MKATQVTELFANIKKTFVSFFSILMFVALGVGVFLGISWAGPALENAADATFEEGNFHNFQISFPYGLTDDDLNKLADVEGVTQVEPARQSFQTLIMDGKNVTVKLQTVGSDIDVLSVVEGELPTKTDEIAFHAESAKEHGISVGDTITFEEDVDDADTTSISSATTTDSANTQDKDGSKYLTGRTFKVTAIVNSPDYLAKESWTYGVSATPSGTVDGLAWVLPDAFDSAAFQDGYPVVNIRCEGLDGKGSYSDEYTKESGVIGNRLTDLGDGLALARYDDLHGQAQAKIDDAQKQLDDGKKQVAEGEQTIADGEKRLEEGKAELETKKAEGQAELAAGYQKLINGEAEYNAGLAEYSTYKANYDSIVSEIEGSRAEIDSMSKEYDQIEQDYKDGKIDEPERQKRRQALADRANASLAPWRQSFPDLPVVTADNVGDALQIAKVLLANYRDIEFEINGRTMTLNQAEQELNAAKAKLDSARAELDYGWGLYYAGQAEYDALVAEGEQKIADGEKELEDARAKIADAKKQIAENEPKLENAKAQLAEMTKYDWVVASRSYNAGSAEISLFSSVTSNLSISMAALFIIVGLLVSYFAVSRIVREQITQIGTKKALGFRQREITTSYLWYSGIAVVSGAIIGTIVGFTLVEGIIGGVLADMFSFGAYPAYFGLPLFLIVTLLELALILAATYLACRGILKEHAVELLKGPKPPVGKTHFYEKWGIWDKLPLLIQTIVNNCVNDKRRVLSTIVGVAGATALIVTAITLNNDVLKSYDKHYDEVYGFNAITYIDDEPDGAIDKVEAVLKDKGATTAQVSSRSYSFEDSNGEYAMITLIAPEDLDAFSSLYHIHLTTGEEADLSKDGAYVTQAYAQHLGAKVGDKVTLSGLDGSTHEIEILGFYDFWLTYHEMVMGHDAYEREFGELDPNVVIADTGDVAVADLEGDLSEVDGFYSISDDKSKQYQNFATFSKVSSAVVAIYLALAALMAVVVLLNLNVMFIDEKKRELIVLMINGFSVKDARHYISYDNIVLTALGIIAGLILGCIMGSVTVAAIEPSTAVFVKSIDGWAVAIGIAGSAILALIMSLIALRRINNFELTDINRF